MNSTFAKKAIVAFLVINALGWVAFIASNRSAPASCPDEPILSDEGESGPEVLDLNIHSSYQVGLDSNRVANVALVFSHSVDTNLLMKGISAEADGASVPLSLMGRSGTPLGDKVVFQTKKPIQGSRLNVLLAPGTYASGTNLVVRLAEPRPVPIDITPRFLYRRWQARADGFDRPVITVSFTQSPSAFRAREGITITPAVDFDVGEGGGWWNNELAITGDFQPGKTYQVALHAGITSDDGGEPLAEPATFEVAIPSRGRAVDFASGGRYLAPNAGAVLPVRAVNVTNLHVTAERILPQNLVQFVMRETSGYDGHWYCYDAGENDNAYFLTDSIAETNLPVRIAKDHVEVIPFPLATLVKGSPRGSFLVGIEAGNGWRYRVVCLTDLAVSLRLESDEARLLVNSLSTDVPSAGVRVTLYAGNNKAIGSATTAADGQARIAIPEDEFPVTVVAEAPDGDITFLPVCGSSSIDLPQTASRNYPANDREASLFTDRGIYRPGETMFVQALFRDRAGNAPAPAPAKIRVLAEDDTVWKTFPLMPDEFGSATRTIELPDYLRAGVYTLHPLSADDHVLGESRVFRIESFVPPQVKLTVAPSTNRVVAGSSVSALLSAEHLFGGAAKGLRARASVVFEPQPFAPKEWKGYTFGDDETKSRGLEPLGEQSVRLDEKGRAAIPFAIPAEIAAPTTIRATILGTVFEEGGRTVRASKSFFVDTAPYYLGLCLGDDGRSSFRPDEKIPVKWAAVQPGGATVPAGALAGTLYRIDTHWALRASRNGEYTWTSTTRREVVAKDIHLSDGGAGDGEASIAPLVEAQYRLVVREATTGRSAAIAFSVSRWADGRAENTRSNVAKIEIKAERDVYAPGEEARVTLRAPFPGTLWIALQNEHILRTQVVCTTNQTMDLVIPVSEVLAPGFEVAATMVRGAAPEEVWTSHRAIGTAQVRVRPPRRVLDVAVETQEVAKPAAVLPVRIRVSRHDGTAPAAARATLLAVDEAICLLTDYQVPKPHEDFLEARSDTHWYYDVYRRLMQVTDKSLVGFGSHVGGDGYGEGARNLLSPVRAKRFKPLALFQSDIVVSNGVADVALPLPEFAGTLRLVAVAYDASAIGSAVRKSKVRRNVVVQPDFPRMLAPGDRSALTLTLHNTSSHTADISMALRSEGPAFFGNAPSPFALAAGASKTISVPLVASNAVGVARLSFEVLTAAGERYFEAAELPVRPATTWQTASATTAVKAGGQALLAPPTNALPSSIRQTLDLAGLPTVDLRAAIDYLSDYPYGCLEQTCSRAFPLLRAASLPAGYLTQGQIVSARATVEAAISRIYSMKAYKCFTMWPGSDESAPADYSLYAIRFLAEAKREGFDIAPFSVDWLAETLRYQNQGREQLARPETCFEPCESALCAVLLGKPDLAAMSTLRARKDLTQTQIGHLARAYLLAGDPAAAQELLGRVKAPPQSLRAAAALLDAWAAIDPASVGASECIRSIQARRDPWLGHWGTTQGNALAFHALAAHTTAAGEVRDPTFRGRIDVLDGAKTESIVFPAMTNATWKAGDAQQTSRFLISNTGTDTLYVRRSIRSVPMDAASLPPLTNGISVVREFLTRDGKPADIAHVKRNDLLVVRIRVCPSSDVRDIVVQDLLPAGLEYERGSLAGKADYPWVGKAIAKNAYWVLHAEPRDDRVLLFSGDLDAGTEYTWCYAARAVSPGEYVVPAVQAEAMYDPARIGRGRPARMSISEE